MTSRGIGRAVLAASILAISIGCGASDDDEPEAAQEDTGAAEGDGVPGAGGYDEAEPTSDPAEVAELIESAGLGCDDFAPDAAPAEEVDASGGCTHTDRSLLTIEAFNGQEGLDAFIAAGQEQGCAFFAGSDVPFVVGDFWTISINAADGSPELSAGPYEALAEAIGGDVDALEC